MPVLIEKLTITEHLTDENWKTEPYPHIYPHIKVNGMVIYFDNGVKFKILDFISDEGIQDDYVPVPQYITFKDINELAQKVAFSIANNEDVFKSKVDY